jgi:hypothetical protein
MRNDPTTEAEAVGAGEGAQVPKYPGATRCHSAELRANLTAGGDRQRAYEEACDRAIDEVRDEGNGPTRVR